MEVLKSAIPRANLRWYSDPSLISPAIKNSFVYYKLRTLCALVTYYSDMQIKHVLVIALLLTTMGCGQLTFNTIEHIKRVVNCEPIGSINKPDIVRRLSLVNGCNSPGEITLISTSNGIETYDVDCSSEIMQFKCEFYSEDICFFMKDDIPFNINTDPQLEYMYEPACWRT